MKEEQVQLISENECYKPSAQFGIALSRRNLISSVVFGAMCGGAATLFGCGGGHKDSSPVPTPTPNSTPTPVVTPTPVSTPTPITTPTPIATPTPGSTRDDSIWGTVVTQSGSVNLTEIGGNSVQVSTAQQQTTAVINNTPSLATSPAATDGSFVASLPVGGVQILTAKDASGSIRGAALWLPSNRAEVHKSRARRGVSDSVVTIDAASTAAALIFATPGIVAVEADVADLRHQQIQRLSHFDQLTQYLRANLPYQSLEQLIRTEAFFLLIQNSIEEWIQLNDSTRHAKRAGRDVSFNDVATGTDVIATVESLGDGNRAAPATILFQNFGWRHVEIFRRDFNGDTEKLVIPVRDNGEDIVDNVTVESWSNLFKSIFGKGDLGEPAERRDYPNFGPGSGLTRAEYWITGPGIPDGSDTLPVSVQPDFETMMVRSVASMIVLPAISVILNALPDALSPWQGDKSQQVKDLVAVVGLILTKYNNLNDLKSSIDSLYNDVIQKKSLWTTSLDVVDLAHGIFTYFTKDKLLYEALYGVMSARNASATTLKLLAKTQIILEAAEVAGDITIAIGNAYELISDWQNLPMAKRLRISLSDQQTTITIS